MHRIDERGYADIVKYVTRAGSRARSSRGRSIRRPRATHSPAAWLSPYRQWGFFFARRLPIVAEISASPGSVSSIHRTSQRFAMTS